MSGREDRLAALRQFQPGDSTQAHYDAWAKDYERDLIEGYGYTAHVLGARAFASLQADRSSQVIDIGCGTGLVGVELHRHGFRCIDGLDISADMLTQAASKQVYRQLLRADLMAGTPLADGSYEAAICVGSFAPGHLGPAALGAITRMVRPGGTIVIFMNAAPFIAEDYASEVRRLSETGAWTVSRIESMNYMTALDRPGRLIEARRA